MLLNNFYKIIAIDYSSDNSSSFNITIELNDKHRIFEGHFPGNPVVPGVCMIQIVKEGLTKVLSEDLYLSEGSNIKFVSVIKPEINNMLQINYNVKRDENNFNVSASISFEEKIFFKLKGIFKTVTE